MPYAAIQAYFGSAHDWRTGFEPSVAIPMTDTYQNKTTKQKQIHTNAERPRCYDKISLLLDLIFFLIAGPVVARSTAIGIVSEESIAWWWLNAL